MKLRCTKCRHYKDSSEFGEDKKKRNGKSSWCKTCMNNVRPRTLAPKRGFVAKHHEQVSVFLRT